MECLSSRMTERVKCSHSICERCQIRVCVRQYLKRKEHCLEQFSTDFQQLKAADEKREILATFLAHLAREMHKDSFWHGKFT